MKKILLTLLAGTLAITGSLAGNFSNSYQLRDFTGIRASSVFNIQLAPSSQYQVSVEAPDYLEPYLVVRVENGQLVLRLESLPKSVERQLSRESSDAVRAEVRMPRLESLSLSGAAKLNAEGTFPTLQRPFRIDLSGASKAKGLSLSATLADISLSGATEMGLRGKFGSVDIDASGASLAKLGIETTTVDAELSGSARVDLDGTITGASLEASGASRADIKSAATLSSLNIEGSGAASIDTRAARAQDISVELSGASNCKVSVIRRLDVEASGASTCLYEAGPDARINPIQVARGASLRKL